MGSATTTVRRAAAAPQSLGPMWRSDANISAQPAPFAVRRTFGPDEPVLIPAFAGSGHRHRNFATGTVSIIIARTDPCGEGERVCGP